MKEEKVFFKNNKDQELCGLLDIPKGKGPFPVVIICHGFKGNKNSPVYAYLAREFSKAGLLAFRFDFHGHGESDGHFEDITISQEVSDLKCAVEFISKNKLAAKGKLGLTAHSLGGFIILRYVAQYNKIKAIVPLSPISDIIDFQNDLRNQAEDYDGWKKKGHTYFYYARIDRWYRLKYSFYLDGMKAPRLYSEVEKIISPILIFHGKNDASIPIKQSKELAKHLKSEHEFITLNEPHVYRKLSTFKFVAEKSIDWFKKYLK
ncbi:MAG: alpha/beta fold hydrolase [Candidatus Woesearchaeota archaeon]|nr:MAG: alpha/beta fold hydrolase [Candidatus Woesearchaeota archaeon]